MARCLSSTTPCLDAPADHHLPGQSDQVHGRELGAGVLLAIVDQHLDAAPLEPLRDALDRFIARASPTRRLIRPALNGATGSGQ